MSNRQWQRMVLDMNDDASEKFARFFQKMQEDAQRWRKMVDASTGFQRAMAELHNRVTSGFAVMVEAQQQTADVLNSLRAPFDRLNRMLERLPGHTRHAVVVLGKNGWYLDLEISLAAIWELTEAFEGGNAVEAEEALAAYYERELPRIEKSLCDSLPERAKILGRAFVAHQREEYELSIPVFLAQADGICQDLIGVSLFRRVGDRRPATEQYVKEQESDAFHTALLHPLAEPLPISASAKECETYLNVLNRHEILHGISVDYGTRINSLKAVSLVNYIAAVLRSRSDVEAD